MELTPDFVGNSFVAILVSYVIIFAFNIYVLYLNYKQSKVNDQMKELVSEVKLIRSAVVKTKKKK